MAAASANADTFTCKPREAYRLLSRMQAAPIVPGMSFKIDTAAMTVIRDGKTSGVAPVGKRYDDGTGLRFQNGIWTIAIGSRRSTGERQYSYAAVATSSLVVLVTKGKCVRAG